MGVTTRSGASTVDTALRLLVVEGTRARFIDLAPKIVFGRASDCDVVLQDETVSRHHAVIFGTKPPIVEDKGSKHGTRVGAERLKAGERRKLLVGDVVVIGKALVSVQSAPDATRKPVEGMIARDASTRALLERVETFAVSRLPILIEGETGTGKELVAEAIHRASERGAQKLVRLNCAALPESLLEAELFGFEKGAFTGATAAKPGLIEAADRGTLFLDEIADLSAAGQAKLLRVLESGEVTRVGALRSRTVDVRLVAASHKNLEGLVARALFRQDLYFRICGAKLVVPPLRERPLDLVALARRFLDESGSGKELSREALRAVEAYAWPGNIRELRVTILRAALLAANARGIEPEHLQLVGAAPVAAPDEERARILAALDQCGHSQTRAAELLGVHRRTLMRRMDALGIARPRKGDSK